MSSDPTSIHSNERPIQLSTTVNGRIVRATIPARMTLADFLRDEMRLTGTHLGCEHGVCGACTVLIDGQTARACLVLACQVEKHHVQTLEGLQNNPVTTRLKAAMSEHHGLQCGFCTPGVLVSATELIESQTPLQPLNANIVREAMSGNICRCTGYQGIVRAILDTASEQAGEGTPAEEPQR